MTEAVPSHRRDGRQRAAGGHPPGTACRLETAWVRRGGAAEGRPVAASGAHVRGAAGARQRAAAGRPLARPWLPRALLVGLCTGLAGVAPATTLAPISFQDLVARAERILVTEVVDVTSREDASRPGLVVTRVTFRVASVLKGPPAAVVALDLPGGTLGEASLEVVGLPRFRIGDRDVLFVKPGGRHLSPFVGFAHGRVRITQGLPSGLARVARFDGRPLASVREFSDPPASRAAQAGEAMTLDRFLAEVAREVRAQETAR